MHSADSLQDWIDEQSPEIKALALRFPPGSRIIDSTATEYFVVGYFEDGALGITQVQPSKDLDLALKLSWCVCKESVAKLRPMGNG
jgi:hypothetical protein